MKKSVTAEQALDFIIKRSDVACDTCNSFHRKAVVNQIRGIMWLFSKEGKEPYVPDNICDVLDYLKIPYEIHGEKVYFGKDLTTFKKRDQKPKLTVTSARKDKEDDQARRYYSN